MKPGFRLRTFGRQIVARAARMLAAALLPIMRPSAVSRIYLGRYIVWSPSGIDDWRRFPERSIAKSELPLRYVGDPGATADGAPALREVAYTEGGRLRTEDLDRLLAETGTTAFIIVKNGSLVREMYLNGHRREAMTRAFSISKAATSALVGVALSEGRIRELDDPFVHYLPELAARGYDGITIRHLLLMTGGLRFSYRRDPWADSPLLYWHSDIRRIILAGPPLVARPGEKFVYSDYSTCILAMVLERVTDTSVSDYFERRIWRPMGAEYDATWSMDHERTGLEYTNSGLNGRAIDLVKLGALYLNGGRSSTRQVLCEKWIAESVSPVAPGQPLPQHGNDDYYKFGWWGHRVGNARYRFWAEGFRGQFIYCCPDRQLVIARFGSDWGSVGKAWPALLRAVADQFPVPG